MNDYPAWATTERSPGVPSYCGLLRGDKFEAFANFVSQLADRYKTREFDVYWGGAIRGKARFLRELMNAYRIQKPLFVNEVSLTCPDAFFPSLCDPLLPEFDAFMQLQASHLVRVHARGLSADIIGFTWYTLDDPGWHNGGLLVDANNPRPGYVAYQVLT